MNSLRIVNLNTWVGVLVRGFMGITPIEPPGHRARRRDALIAGLRDLDPDIVTLQECLPLPSLVKEVAQALGYDRLWRVQNRGLGLLGVGLPWGIGRGEGLAILARPGLGLTHLQTQRLSGRGLVTNWFSFQFSPVRFAMAARIVKDGQPVVAVVTHIRYAFPDASAFDQGWAAVRARDASLKGDPPPWLQKMGRDNRAAREVELSRFATWIRQLRERYQAPVVVGADFNLEPDAPQLTAFLAQTDLVNLLPAYVPGALTWDPVGNYNVGFGTHYTWEDGTPKPMALQLMAYLDSIPQCPDHVMASPELTPQDARVVLNTAIDEVLPSDHYGICADLALPE